MYTGIIYLNLDSKQDSTTYICPYQSEITGNTKLTEIECIEGTLVIFPAFLLHYVKPNLLKKPRVVISFDINCT